MGLKTKITRKPFQGVWNIIRFNWHFYLIALVGILGLLLCKDFFPTSLHSWVMAGVCLTLGTTLISLLVSYYVYDYSNLYELNWLEKSERKEILNINADFDETSELIKNTFPGSSLTICDFYDPQKHTEVSIKRARKVYPPDPKTISVNTQKLPFLDHQFDQVLAILAAHEIREETERIKFLKELKRVSKPKGNIYIMEHLRDLNNFLAYTIGFLHFYSRTTWLRSFTAANLQIEKEIKITPFVTILILKSHGNPS